MGPARMHAVKKTEQSPGRTDSGAGQEIAKFGVSHVRFLDAAGNAIVPLPPCANDRAELVKMYRTMVLSRAFDIKAVNLQRIGKLGTYPPAIGHEAVQVACGAALRDE